MQGKTFLEDFVQAADAYPDGLDELIVEEFAVLNELGKVETSEKTASSCGEGLLGTGVGSCVGIVGEFAEEVPAGDPVPIEASGLSEIPVGVAEPLEELGRIQLFSDLFSALGAVELLCEHGPLLDASHELVRDTDGHICLGDPLEIRLDIHELLEVRMVA